MKSNLTPKLFLLALVSVTLFSCSVNDDELVSNKIVKPEMDQQIAGKSGDSTFVEGEPIIPKPRG